MDHELEISLRPLAGNMPEPIMSQDFQPHGPHFAHGPSFSATRLVQQVKRPAQHTHTHTHTENWWWLGSDETDTTEFIYSRNTGARVNEHTDPTHTCRHTTHECACTRYSHTTHTRYSHNTHTHTHARTHTQRTHATQCTHTVHTRTHPHASPV